MKLLLQLACLVYVATSIVHGYTTSTKCNAATLNKNVCISCQTYGQCKVFDDGTGNLQYYVIESTDCATTDQFCQTDAEDNASCDAALTDIECLCQAGTDANSCKADPYGSDSAFLDCQATTMLSSTTDWVQCEDYQTASAATCSCLDPVCPSLCNVYIEPNTLGCGKYYSCGTGAFVESSCGTGLCYDTTSCACNSGVCPTCGYAQDTSDPTNSGYYQCNAGTPMYGTCGDMVFDQTKCACVPSGTSSECPACGSKPYGPDCSDYYICTTDPWEEYRCLNPDICFNELTCKCVDCPTCGYRAVEGSLHDYQYCADGVTSPDVLSCGSNFFDPNNCECRTCNECGSIEDHVDTSCGGYIYCSETVPVLTSCQNTDYCYNSTSCTCDPPSSTCPACGARADATDPTIFYKCSQDGSSSDIKEQCGGGTIFYQDICQCA